MTARGRAILAIMTLVLGGGCHGSGSASPAEVVPSIQYRTNTPYAPGYVSPCAGGQPQMQYNCPQSQN